ncbi:hypothetical protein V2G26_004512 [Clonostachys chloroleuca]|uniref:Uncharacterized protein n=1 Tax=Clonostachys chloroleuca TaxID=1926264 RepID=A0AA35QD00_9HYPO|nr:unnamed protein product [Clonostachys chloroleuca]
MVVYPPYTPTTVVQGRRTRWWAVVLHFVPIACTVILAYINFAQLYWFPLTGIDGRDRGSYIGSYNTPVNGVLNSLQLAAKLFEISVVASLGTLILDIFKWHFAHQGLPFSLLTGAYRVFDVMYVLRPRFWSAAPRAVWLSALLFLCVLLCALVGPASAILVIPKLGWYALPGAFSNMYMPVFVGKQEAVYPTSLNASLFDDAALGFCRGQLGSYTSNCPAAGLSTIYDWEFGWTSRDLPNNVTFGDSSGTVSRRLDMWSNGLNGTLFTSPTALSVGTLGVLNNYIAAENVGSISQTKDYKIQVTAKSQSFQPLIQAKCNIYNRNDYAQVADIPLMSFPNTFNCFTSDSTDRCQRIRAELGQLVLPSVVWDRDDIDTLFNVVGGKTVQNADLSFLVFTARLPYVHEGKPSKRIATCSYVAHWLPATLMVDPSNNIRTESNVTDLSIFSGTDLRNASSPRAAVGSYINIEKTWLPFLDLKAAPSSNGKNYTAFDNMAYLLNPMVGMGLTPDHQIFAPGSSSKSTKDGDRLVQLAIEKLTGTIVTDAIARTGASISAAVARPGKNPSAKSIIVTNLKNIQGQAKDGTEFFANGTSTGSMQWPAGVTTLDGLVDSWKDEYQTMYLEAERFGYGYGKSGAAMIFAMVVLFLYAITVLSYVVGLIITQMDMVSGLYDMEDMVALAWKSASPAAVMTLGYKSLSPSLANDLVAMRSTMNREVTMALENEDHEGNVFMLGKDEEYF